MMKQRQIETLEFIYKYQKEKGWAPSVREMQIGLSLGSTNSVWYRIGLLEDEGYVTRERRVARAISITELGMSMLAKLGLR